MADTPQTIADLDRAFVAVLSSWCEHAASTASEAAEKILFLSSNFLSDKAQKALADFHRLWRRLL